ncbi:MAG: acyltransferase family protein [Thermoleophilaceae bacterium]
MHARSVRFPLMDSLRALAALAVVGTHAAFFSQALAEWGILRALSARLDVGVTIFFLISGFLLYRPFVAARFASESPPLARAYGWRRLLRIVPAYWTALTGSAVWLGLGVFTAGGVAVYYGLLQVYFPSYALGGLPQAWTLCVEITFYAFLPLYAWLMRRLPATGARGLVRGELAGLAALFLIALAWQAWRVSAAADPDHAAAAQGLLYLPAFLDHFALGMGLAVASVALTDRRLPSPLAVVDRHPWLPWLGALAAFWIVSTGIGLDGVGGLAEPTDSAQYFARHYLYALVALGVLMPAVFGDPERGLVRRLLAQRWLLYLGLVSYGIYLWHFSVFVQLDEWGFLEGAAGPGVMAAWILMGAAGATALASASYWLIERPALGLKRLVPVRREAPGAPPREAPGEPLPEPPDEAAPADAGPFRGAEPAAPAGR